MTSPIERPLQPTDILQLHVQLEGITPPVWRRLQVPAAYSFWDLHVVLQNALGWEDSHLHAFTMRDPARGRSVRLAMPDDEGLDDDDTAPDGTRFLHELFAPDNRTACYEYDFGDPPSRRSARPWCPAGRAPTHKWNRRPCCARRAPCCSCWRHRTGCG